MTQIKYSSFKMPSSNLSGITIGGGAWFQHDFNIGNPATWNGIVIDPDGKMLGAEHVGLTVWETGTKRAQINFGGIALIGGSSIWAPAGYNPSDPASWNGVVINSSGISAYHGSAVATVNIEASTGNITLGKSGGPQLKYTASTGVFAVPAMTTEILAVGSLATGTGALLDSGGIRAYKTSVQTVNIEASTGNFTFGSTAGKRLLFDAATGKLTIERLTVLRDADDTERTAGDVFKGGYRASLKLDANGKINLDDVTDGTSYKLLSAANMTNLNDIYTRVTSTIIIDPGVGYTFGAVADKRIKYDSSTGKLTIEKLAILKDSDGTERTAGDVFKGGYRASLKLDANGKINLDDVTDGTTYKLLTATKLSQHDTAYTNSASIDSLPDGTTYKKLTATNMTNLNDIYTRVTQTIDTSYNVSIGAGKYITIDTSGTYGYLRFTDRCTLYATTAGIFLSSASESYPLKLGTAIGSGRFESIELHTVNGFMVTGGGFVRLAVDTVGTKVRHINGSNTLFNAYDDLYLQYHADGKGVKIGDSGNDHALTVYGNVSCGGSVESPTSDHVYMQYYAATGKGVQIGDSGTDHPLFVCGDVSGSSITDRTPYPDSYKTAKDAILSMSSKKNGSYNIGEVDHDTMHEFIKSTVKDNDGNDIIGRNLSATVSCLVEVVKQLISKG